MSTQPRKAMTSVPSVPLAASDAPPTLTEIVRRLQFVRAFKDDAERIVGVAFGGAWLDGHDKPTMALLLRTPDGRAWGDMEPMDAMADPMAQARAMVGRALKGGDCKGMLPLLDSLHGMCAPNGKPDSAGRTNMANAISRAAKELERAGHEVPTDAESYGDAQRASFEQTRLLLGVTKLFEGTLDPEALALARSRRVRLREVDGPGLWEAMDATFDPSAPVARAMRAEPGLARAIAWAFEDDRAGFEAALAEGRLDPYLAPRTGLPRRLWPALPALGGVTGEMSEGSLPPSPSREDPLVHWVGRLALLPPEWVPDCDIEWRAYLECQPAVDWALERSRDPAHLRVMLNRGSGWYDFMERMEQASGGVELREALRNVGHMTEALARQVLVPALVLSGAAPARHRPEPDVAATALLTSGRSVTRVLEGSERWHAVQHGIAARLTQSSPDFARAMTWEPGLPDADYGGHEVVVLRDAPSVVDEGRRGTNADGTKGLSHCVGGYVGRCANNESRILSVRRIEADGRRTRLSTVEMTPFVKEGGMSVRLTQHLGEGNRRPGAEALEVFERYLDGLRRGDLKVDWHALYPKLRSHAPKDEAGYDFETPGSWEAARDLWRDILPKAALGMDAATLASSAMAPLAARERDAWEPVWEPATFGSPAWPDAAADGQAPSR